MSSNPAERAIKNPPAREVFLCSGFDPAREARKETNLRPAEFEPRFVLAHRLCFSSSRQLASVTCFVTFAGAVRAACQKRQNFARRQKTTGAAVVFYTPARRARHKKSSRKGGFFYVPGSTWRGKPGKKQTCARHQRHNDGNKNERRLEFERIRNVRRRERTVQCGFG